MDKELEEFLIELRHDIDYRFERMERRMDYIENKLDVLQCDAEYITLRKMLERNRDRLRKYKRQER